ncbi:receptor like protein kinase S.2-like [Rutidosis leptorrhynchoides]|uniref:receptor like protein kinase S.2-like n=1 Tax=Rutidosis leptorrhynchoides TaxID=125765 RepID=UPI003A9A2D90
MSSLFKELDYLRIPYADIKAATNNFDTKNKIQRFSFIRYQVMYESSVHKGELYQFGQRINIIVEQIPSIKEELLKWVSVLSRFKHKNIPTFVGFCYDKYDCGYLVSECEFMESLEQILSITSDPDYRSEYCLDIRENLTCYHMLQICLGVARALSHIHDCHAIHGAFNSYRILLDKDFEAKVVGLFENPEDIPRIRYTSCYIDPEFERTKTVTPKSDVYSFGVVLIDVFCQQYAYQPWHYQKFPKIPEIEYTHFDDNICKQMNSKALTILLETLNKCLNNEREERPDMAEVVKQLEEALFLQWKHENPEIIKIGLDDVKLATENFAEKYLIGSGGYGKVYKAKLPIYDPLILEIQRMNQEEIPKNEILKKRNFFTKGKFLRNATLILGGKSKREIPKNETPNKECPKKHHTVAIKHILKDENGLGRQGFFLEIEMLRRCNHPNIVSLIGYCDEDSELILVYEFVPNGSLDDYLEGKKKETYLNWVQRIKICLDIAHGLDYLHTKMSDEKRIIHRDIKSANILLGTNWEAKIADFGLSKFYRANQLASTIVTDRIAGTGVYLDPEYSKTGKLKKQSDIYSFGVVLFEVFSGTLAYEKIYTDENDKGLAAVARRRFSEGTLMEIVDPQVMEETEERCFGMKVGPNQESLETFAKIAIQCLAETQGERPKLTDITKELEIALSLQETRKDILEFSLEDMQLATENFSEKNFIKNEGFGMLYRGEVLDDIGCKIPVILKVTKSSEEDNFLRELEILFGHKHENIIGIVGYCKEKGDKIIVYENYENAYNVNTLNSHVNDVSLTWTKRLEICLGIANGLKFLHKGFARQQSVVHRDIKSANIILNGDWSPKLCGFGFSLIIRKNQEMEYFVNDVPGSLDYCDPVYCDPVYWKTGFLTKESDIYSFGVVLFEMLCGTLACVKDFRESKQFQDFLVDEIVLEGIKEQVEAKSLATFGRIAYQCLHEEPEKRPKADEVYMQLKKALDIQVLNDRLAVKKDLYSLKLEEGGDLSDHIVTFKRLVSKLSTINEIIKEEDLALYMLLSLPKSYKRFVDNMSTGITSLKLRDVLQKLGDKNYTNEISYV